MFKSIKKKVEEIKKPNTTTLERYHIHFKTVDGEQHICTRLCAGNPQAITSRNIPKHYLLDRKYLIDDEDVRYPICNVISIRFELIEKIHNVIEIMENPYFKQLWYQNDEIEIFEE